MPNSARLRLIDGMQFEVTSGSGHAVVIDSGSASGGTDAAMSPMELVLAALGGCGGMDIVSILRKMCQEVTAYDIDVAGERASEHPKVYTAITMTHRFEGTGLDEANVQRAVRLSMTRYCPVFAMLAPSVAITVRYEITDDARVMRSGTVEPLSGRE